MMKRIRDIGIFILCLKMKERYLKIKGFQG